MAVVIHSFCADATMDHEPVDRSSISSSAFRSDSTPAVTGFERSRSATMLSTERRSLSCGSGSGAR